MEPRVGAGEEPSVGMEVYVFGTYVSLYLYLYLYVYVYVSACACACACARACASLSLSLSVCVCVRARVYVGTCGMQYVAVLSAASCAIPAVEAAKVRGERIS